MTHEHDKEIDSLLRRLAKNEAVAAAAPSSGTHIDADEISVYAENALPEKARARVTAHLADCGRCRTILSNVVALNVEHKAAEDSAGMAIDLQIPWYRKLFAVRGLSMAMGAVAVLLAGFLAIVVIRNLSGSGSQMAESANYMANTNAAPAAEQPLSESAPAESDSGTQPEAEKQIPENERAEDRSKKPETPPGLEENQLKKDESGRRDADEARLADSRPAAQATPAAPAKARPNSVTLSSNVPAGAAPAPPPPPADVAQAQTMEDVAATEESKVETAAKEADKGKLKTLSVGRSKNSEPSIRQVSGKTFVNRKGVWTDYAYKGGEVTKVKKGTDAYRALDSGLRSIADQFSSPVIVVWKTKAFRVE